MNQEIKRNKGVFRAEARLWCASCSIEWVPVASDDIELRTCYLGVLIYVVGFVILGAALQNHLNKAAIIVGWGIAQIAVLVITVPVCESFRYMYFKLGVQCIVLDAYCNDCFPGEQVE